MVAVVLLLAAIAAATLLQASVMAGGSASGHGPVVEILPDPLPPSTDHDLAVTSFGKLFLGNPILGDTVAFSFEVVNQGAAANTADWSIVSDNTTPGTADDIVIAAGSSPLPSGFSLKTGPSGISWNTIGTKTGDHTVTMSVAPVNGESAAHQVNNTRALAVRIVDQPTHDVAVIGIVALSGDGLTPLGTGAIPSGAQLVLNVSTHNRGTTIDNFSLSVWDDTDIVHILTLNVMLDPGQLATFGVPWDTHGGSSGDHTMRATASLAGDEDPGNNTLTTFGAREHLYG